MQQTADEDPEACLAYYPCTKLLEECVPEAPVFCLKYTLTAFSGKTIPARQRPFDVGAATAQDLLQVPWQPILDYSTRARVEYLGEVGGNRHRPFLQESG